MPTKFNSFLERPQIIELHQSTSLSLLSMNQKFTRVLPNIREIVNGECNLNKHQLLGTLIGPEFNVPTSYYNLGADLSACWIPFDKLMENAMDGRHLYGISAAEILTNLTKTLQMVNQASWQETFMAIWVSGLSLVQRDREPWEGPIHHLDARLCMLLSIVPLAIVSIMKEDLDTLCARSSYEHTLEVNKLTSRRHGLVSSLQLLGQNVGLLSPPPSIVNVANNAAAKAAKYITNFRNGSSGMSNSSQKAASVKTVGNMLHVIVEACIARKLIDTSAYFWLGYVIPPTTSKESVLIEESPWSAFMEGSQLTGSLKNALLKTPASSLVELEKLYYTAVNGSEEEKSAAVKIL